MKAAGTYMHRATVQLEEGHLAEALADCNTVSTALLNAGFAVTPEVQDEYKERYAECMKEIARIHEEVVRVKEGKPST